MKKTFDKLLEYMSQSEPNVTKAGRLAHYCVPDMIEKGLGLIEANEYKVGLKTRRVTAVGDDEEYDEGVADEGVDMEIEEDDLRVDDHNGENSDDGG